MLMLQDTQAQRKPYGHIRRRFDLFGAYCSDSPTKVNQNTNDALVANASSLCAVARRSQHRAAKMTMLRCNACKRCLILVTVRIRAKQRVVNLRIVMRVRFTVFHQDTLVRRDDAVLKNVQVHIPSSIIIYT